MAQLKNLNATCSMMELANVEANILRKSIPNFVKTLKETNELYEHIEVDNCKSIIYNTTRTTKGHINNLSRLGFTKVYEYMGNSQKMVHTYIADGQKLLSAYKTQNEV